MSVKEACFYPLLVCYVAMAVFGFWQTKDYKDKKRECEVLRQTLAAQEEACLEGIEKLTEGNKENHEYVMTRLEEIRVNIQKRYGRLEEFGFFDQDTVKVVAHKQDGAQMVYSCQQGSLFDPKHVMLVSE